MTYQYDLEALFVDLLDEKVYCLDFLAICFVVVNVKILLDTCLWYLGVPKKYNKDPRFYRCLVKRL